MKKQELHIGADNSAPSNLDLHKGKETSIHSDENRQYYSQVLHQPYQGDSLSNPQCNSFKHMELVPVRHLYSSAEYLLGVENQVANKESKHLEDHCDWMLHPQVFEQINNLMDPLQLEVDLFAFRLTHQLPRFSV